MLEWCYLLNSSFLKNIGRNENRNKRKRKHQPPDSKEMPVSNQCCTLTDMNIEEGSWLF